MSYEGCPLVVRNGVVDPVPSTFLMYLWREGFSRDTIKTYAYALKRWLIYLAFRGLEWWRANLGDVTKLRRSLEGRRAGSTINITLAAIAKFHTWLRGEGLCAAPEFKVARSKSKRSDGKAVLKGSRVVERKVRDVKKDELDATLAASSRQDSGACLRDELAAELGYWSGLRRMEVAGLELRQIDKAKPSGEVYLVDIVHTKGGKAREVIIPNFLLHRIRRYIDVYRRAIVSRRSNRRHYREPLSVFLTKHGNPLSREYITQSWAQAARKAGVPVSFHGTRHGYGTRAANAVQAAGLPLRIVSVRMGHADERTTLRYIHSRPVVDHDPWSRPLIRIACDG